MILSRLVRAQLERTRRCAVCLANVQPASAFGSPEQLIERGREFAAVSTASFAAVIGKALEGKTDEKSIRAALRAVESRFPTGPFALFVEQEVLAGLMLGALDAALEADEGKAIEPVAFVDRDKRWTRRPYADAIKQFLAREVVTRDVFDEMKTEAKRRAFTVAGMASTAMIDTVKSELGNALERGADLRDFRKFAEQRLAGAGWTPANPSHVETIFRTNVLGAYSGGRHRQMTQPAVLALRPYWQVLTPNDGPPRQRPNHQKAHAAVFRADDPVFPDAFTPWDYNSFLPTTLVSGRFVGAARARYSGQAVELTTAKGRRLSVTADHPVLTPTGFRRARELRHGDQLIGYRDQPGVATLARSAQGHEDHGPATAEQVFRALAYAGSELRRCVGNDFHGEAARFIGDVEIVGSYRALTGNAQPALCEQHRQVLLEPTDLRGAALLALLSEGGPHAFVASLGPAADLDIALREDSPQGLPADAELAAELQQRHPGRIEIDQVREVRCFTWSGHVYDFETSVGWLAADQVIAANCRCRMRSLSERQVRAMGLTVKDGSFLTGLGLPAPGFGGGSGGIEGVMTGPVAKVPPPVEGPAAPPGRPPAAPGAPPAAPPRRPRRPRPAPPVAPAPAPLPPAPEPTPPKPAEPPAAKPPKLPKAPTARLKAVVARMDVVGKDAKVMLPKVAKALDDCGLSKLMGPGSGGIDNFTITDKFGSIQSNTEIAEGALGMYWNPPRAKPGSYYFAVSTNRPAIQLEMKGARLRRARPPEAGRPQLWAVTDLAETEAEFIQMATVHEFGHALHHHQVVALTGTDVDTLQQQIDGVVQTAFTAETDRLLATDDASHITEYAGTNRNEFFAEAFSFFHHRPGELKKASPIAFNMVQAVLKLRGM